MNQFGSKPAREEILLPAIATVLEVRSPTRPATSTRLQVLLCALATSVLGMAGAPAWAGCDLAVVRSQAEQSLPDFEVKDVNADAGTVTLLLAKRNGTGTFAISLRAAGTQLFSAVMDLNAGTVEVARAQQVLGGWQEREDLQRVLVQCCESGSDVEVGDPRDTLRRAVERALRGHDRTAPRGPRLLVLAVVVLAALAFIRRRRLFVSDLVRPGAVLERLGSGLTLLLFSLLVTVAFAEVAIRGLGIDDRLVSSALQFTAANTKIHRPSDDPFLHYELRPNSSAHWDNCPGRAPYSITIDDFGARTPTHPFAKGRGVFRVLAFGASTMHGACVNDNETIPAVMETMLNAAPRPAGAPRFEVWNFGTSGYILAQAAHLARGKLEALQPDLVIVQLHNLSPRGFILSEDAFAARVAPAGLSAVVRKEPGFANEQFADPFVPPAFHERAFDRSAFYRSLVAWAKLHGYLGPDCPACLDLDAEEAEGLSREAESRGIPVAYLVIPGDHYRAHWNRFLFEPSDRLIDLYRPARDPDFYEVHPRAPQLADMAVAIIEELRVRHLLPD